MALTCIQCEFQYYSPRVLSLSTSPVLSPSSQLYTWNYLSIFAHVTPCDATIAVHESLNTHQSKCRSKWRQIRYNPRISPKLKYHVDSSRFRCRCVTVMILALWGVSCCVLLVWSVLIIIKKATHFIRTRIELQPHCDTTGSSFLVLSS